LPSQLRLKGEEVLETCIVYLLYKWPLLQEIRHLYSWTHSDELGQSIESYYPSGVPNLAVEGLLSFHAGIKQGIHDKSKHDREKSKSKSKSR
jgi:hypothetical protein